MVWFFRVCLPATLSYQGLAATGSRQRGRPMARSPLEQSLHALTRFVVGDATVAETLQRIVDLSVAAVPPVAYTAISMLVENKVTTAVFSDPDAVEIDQAQYAAGT